MYQIRTDLALETQEKMQEDHVELKGVRFLEERIDKNRKWREDHGEAQGNLYHH